MDFGNVLVSTIPECNPLPFVVRENQRHLEKEHTT
jgi:hypothetical protein